MNKNNDSKLALLTSVVLGSLVLFLIFLCHRLILCIARVFVYLTENFVLKTGGRSPWKL